MANISAIRKQAAPITYFLVAQQEPYQQQQKSLNLNEKCLRIFRKRQDNGPLAKNKTNNKTERARGLGRKEKTTSENKIEIGKGNRITVLRLQTGEAS